MKRSLRTQAIDFAAHMRRRWYLYLPVFAIWIFAYTRLFIDPTPRVPVLFNWTGSLPAGLQNTSVLGTRYTLA